MKYIVVEDQRIPRAILFPDSFTHYDIARALAYPVLGAGFAVLESGRFVAYGKSVSLDIASRGVFDSDVLNNLLVRH